MPVEHDVTEAAVVAAGVVSDELVAGGGGGCCCWVVWTFWVLMGCWRS